jgi:hypothetical protein
MASIGSRVEYGVQGKGKTHRAAPGRVCRTDGCATVLSIYNDSPQCSLHEIRVTKFSRPQP